MTIEPVVLHAQTEMRVVEQPRLGAEQEPPTAEQQRAADAVFSDAQDEAAAALLALQMGVGLAHALAVDAFRKDPEPARVPPRKKRDEGEG